MAKQVVRRLITPEVLCLQKLLEKVVIYTGNVVLSHSGNVHDIAVRHGHEESSIDTVAREAIVAAIDDYLPDFQGAIRVELHPFNKTHMEGHSQYPAMVLVIDEIDGTTNTKRALASAFSYPPKALVSCALSMTDSLRDLVASAVYTLDHQQVFSAFKVDDTFLSLWNNTMLRPTDFADKSGDNSFRAVVPCYSNTHVEKHAQVCGAMWGLKIKPYGGCRSSGMDIVDILLNQFDAYVDCRSFWSTKDDAGKETEAMLQTYDIAGMLPIAMGCGLVVTDCLGQAIDSYGSMDDLSLVVSRPGIHGKIIEAISPLVNQWQKDG